MKYKILVFLFMLTIIVGGCTDNVTNEKNQNIIDTQGMSCVGDSCGVSSAEVDVEKIEIYHFHGTNQCVSCIAVGDLAEETVNTYFSKELKSGKIIFAHINGELPENKEKVEQYGATGSSLWLGVYTEDGRFMAEQNINVWYKIKNKEEYMTYLKGVIDKRLEGDFS